jgi:hypothetical protein
MACVQLWSCFELPRAPLMEKFCNILASKDIYLHALWSPDLYWHRLVSSYTGTVYDRWLNTIDFYMKQFSVNIVYYLFQELLVAR